MARLDLLRLLPCHFDEVLALLAGRKAGDIDALAPLFDALAAFGYRVPADLMREALRRAGVL